MPAFVTSACKETVPLDVIPAKLAVDENVAVPPTVNEDVAFSVFAFKATTVALVPVPITKWPPNCKVRLIAAPPNTINAPVLILVASAVLFTLTPVAFENVALLPDTTRDPVVVVFATPRPPDVTMLPIADDVDSVVLVVTIDDDVCILVR